MGFADKALHFERCAKRARDHDSRHQFEEAADFYRKLAGIASDFPPKFPGGKIWRGTHWEKRAEECRTMAEHFTDPMTQATMRRLADSYDKLAHSQIATAAE
jgi:hypothetical protein